MSGRISHRRVVLFLSFISLFCGLAGTASADGISDYPIVFVTYVPNPRDFGTLAATFSNHSGSPSDAYRGGDLWIRYPDRSLKNLTEAAGYGNSGMQGANSIAVRDPAVHWDGTKVIFSMLVGAPAARYQLTSHRWQLYEIQGLGSSETPQISKVPNQPADYHNFSPAYGSDDSIIFISDRPRDNTVLHTYPQRDEYESAASNSGLWKLQPQTGKLDLLDHSPSGNFNPIIDSFGRIIFSRWDHLQRDQQNVGASLGAYNYNSETGTTKLNVTTEHFPEPRSALDLDYNNKVNLFTINQFSPWMANQDGTELETLNHIGRHEVGMYIERNFNDDPNVQEFYSQYQTGDNLNEFTIFLHIKEDPVKPGTYFGTSCQEFGTHASGQIISITGPPGMNPDRMTVTYITHPDTSGASDSPSSDHSGLYRDPLPLSNGNILASHTGSTQADTNIGSSGNPQSRYDLRLKLLQKDGAFFKPAAALTTGITKSISFWSPDNLISYSGPLWEVSPVELRPRARPAATQQQIPDIEASVINAAGVSEQQLRAYLRENNLALVISRNVTTRDRNDRQQPRNLRVSGTSTQTLASSSGKIYDVALLQFFQGDLIRGYNNGNQSGRRVLAMPMHSLADGTNLPGNFAAGSVAIASDGSIAAFVPARRALTWQLSDLNGAAVVRERYWLTFQPGEIRVCASCHGINTADQAGGAAPTNPPLALAQLLAHWQKNPIPQPTPIAGDQPNKGNYSLEALSAAGGKKRIRVLASGSQAGEQLILQAKFGKRNCAQSLAIQLDDSAEGILTAKLPATIKPLTLRLMSGTEAELASAKINQKDLKARKISAAKACAALFKSLRQEST